MKPNRDHNAIPDLSSWPVTDDDPVASGIRAYVERYAMPQSGARILVALSGGPDSVAMLAVLSALAPGHSWKIEAAHVNYRMRGDESDGDEAFCRELCRRWAIPLHVRQAPKPDDPGFNTQSWARTIRYAFFEEWASAHHFDHIAVGHTLEDRAETVAAAVIEARGTFALAGIPPVRGRIIRPLFLTSRRMVTEFLKARGIPFRSDSTNASDAYLRNRVRHAILPGWQALNPGITDGLARLGEQLWRQGAYLYRQAAAIVDAAMVSHEDGRVVLALESLSGHDAALDPFFLRVLMRAIGSQTVPAPATVERFGLLRRLRTTGRVEQGDVRVECSKQCIIVSNVGGTPGPLTPVRFAAGESFQFGRHRFRSEIVESVRVAMYDDSRAALLDLDHLREPFSVRTLETGDRYDPMGLKGHKKIADLLADRGVPAALRRDVPILTDADGVVWPVGHPIAQRARVTPETKRALCVRVDKS